MSVSIKKILFIILVFYLPGQIFAANRIHFVSIDHPVYTVIDYLQSTQTSGVDNFQRPYTRHYIRTILIEADLQNIADRNMRELIKRYLNEFHDQDRHLVNLSSADYYLTGDAEFGWSGKIYRETIPFHRIYMGADLRGQVGDNLFFQSNIRTLGYLANLDLDSGYGIKRSQAPIKYHSWQNHITADINTSHLSLLTSWGYLSLGNNYFSWGPGRSGNLLIDLDQYPLNNIQGGVQIGPLRYVHFAGILDNLYLQDNGTNKEYLANKRKLSAHRLDLILFKHLSLGLSESIVYNRDWEFAYLNPLNPYVIGEVYAGDADNNLGAIDLSAQVTRSINTYFELLFDDVDFFENWFTKYVNKWAVLGGFMWNQPLGLQRTNLELEIIRVEPYVYSHRDTANHYEYYGQSIGYDLEPNSLRYHIALTWFQRYNLWHRFTFTHTKHGAGDRIYGTPDDIDAEKQFLAGIIEVRNVVQWQIDYEFYENMWLRLALHYETVQNPRIDDTFSATGSDYTRNGLTLGIDINY